MTGRLSIGGAVNLHGRTQDLRFIVTDAREVHIQRKGSLTGLLYAPKSEVEINSTVYGSVVGAEVKAPRPGQRSECSGFQPGGTFDRNAKRG